MMNINKTIDRAIEKYGEKQQKIVAIEEMSELTKEISKDLRGKPDIAHITEEMADVNIMLMQLQKMYNINLQTLFEAINNKLDRLEKRLDDEESRKD